MRLPVFLVIAALLIGCASQPAPDRSDERETNRARRVLTQTPTNTTAPSRGVSVSPPAAVNGTPITWDAMHTALVEGAGGVVLEEIVLDRLLSEEARRLGVRVERVDMEREERALLDSLAGVGSSGSETALLERLRRQRGLGPERYQALLRRTAIMRAIVAPDVNITQQTLDLAHDVRFGEKRRARIITSPTLVEAETALRAIRRGEPFAEAAVRLSTDASAARGGLIEPMSLADPSYPASVREAARDLQVGEVSPAVAIEGGYALLKLEEIIPARTPAGGESMLLEDARAEQERVLMTALARRLLNEASVSIFDPSLETAWRRRGN